MGKLNLFDSDSTQNLSGPTCHHQGCEQAGVHVVKKLRRDERGRLVLDQRVQYCHQHYRTNNHDQ